MSMRLRELPICPQGNVIEGKYGKSIIAPIIHHGLSLDPLARTRAFSLISPDRLNRTNRLISHCATRSFQLGIEHSAEQDGYFAWSDGLRARLE